MLKLRYHNAVNILALGRRFKIRSSFFAMDTNGMKSQLGASVSNLWILVTVVFISEINGIYHHHLHADPALAIPFCQERTPGQCCPGRNDDCIMPILDTICYCDQFCNR